MIGIIAGPMLGEMMLRRIMMATQVAQDRGYDVMLYSPRFDDESYEKAINSLASHRVQGMIVASAGLSTLIKSNEAWKQQQWPTVCLLPMQPFSMENLVDTDRAQGYRGAVAYLVELGHQAIGIVPGPDWGWTDIRMTTRLDGYRAGLKDAGIEYRPELVFQMELKSDSDASELAGKIWATQPRPTALLTYSDEDGLLLIRHLMKMGVRVPQDISVVGFDDGAAAKASILPLTTIAQPINEIARRAVDKLLEISDGQQTQKFDPILCPAHLVVRESTSSPSETGR
jgi:LacI family transcriptional regulator